jgi:hypothetical protein
MSTWALQKEAIRVAVRDVTGLEDADVYWAGTSQESTWHASGAPQAQACLTITADREVGEGEIRQTYDAGSDSRTAEVCGSRVMTVTVRIESETAEGADEAAALARRIRLRIRTPDILAGLLAESVSVAKVDRAIPASYPSQGRMISVNVVDLILHVAESEIDEPSGTGWIERAQGTLEIPAGTVVGTFDTDI